ncbi:MULTISPECIES: DUF4012 domain-containing protein [Microbacterium]|uniref:DUF4012 domain-containing protein n=1 Tax=Microbacterium TaxID=33882 RepID=UPI00109BE4A3|nr:MULTISPECIES: DUF4012 domain-containing protein [Microbacterium]MBN6190250.1 DUF4012 domain-containing protein [Aneurinibacillus sp. BA2021]MCK2026903.1 DUF4012 domain-containing protein [Microbacterium sufflavum]
MSDGRLPARRRWIGWTIGILLTLLVIAIGWVTVRGIGAVDDLRQVAKGATQLKQAIAEGDLDGAEPISDAIARNAASAHDLTSDPIWHAFGVLPWVGPNFQAVSEIAEIADDVSTEALRPLLQVGADLDLSSLGFTDGAINLAPFAQVEEPLAAAAASLTSADDRAKRIDADATLPPLADAIRQMRGSVTQAATVVGSLHGAAVLLPTMLGGDGPRTYVLAMQNNAELRSSGGIIGSIALLHAENGRVTLQSQASTRDFPALDVPLPVSESTTALFEDRPGRFLQNITSIPDFREAGETIAARWVGRFGGQVDGVIAVDALVAEHLMEVTGDLTFGPFTATSDTITSILLSEIYAAVPDPVAQDDIFALAAGGLFGAALSGGDPQALIGALADAAGEGRIRIWSAHEDEETLLAASALGGTIPPDSADTSHVGVLFNDGTGAKMDYYTRATIATAVGRCDGEPTTQITVTWTNTAPADAATSLPPYVTGDGFYGVPPGTVRTLIAVYGPEGATPSHVDRDGEDDGVQTAMLGDRSVVQHEVQLAPGESTTITVEFQGTGAGQRLTEVLHTPLITGPELTKDTLRCGS